MSATTDDAIQEYLNNGGVVKKLPTACVGPTRAKLKAWERRMINKHDQQIQLMDDQRKQEQDKLFHENMIISVMRQQHKILFPWFIFGFVPYLT